MLFSHIKVSFICKFVHEIHFYKRKICNTPNIWNNFSGKEDDEFYVHMVGFKDHSI